HVAAARVRGREACGDLGRAPGDHRGRVDCGVELEARPTDGRHRRIDRGERRASRLSGGCGRRRRTWCGHGDEADDVVVLQPGYAVDDGAQPQRIDTRSAGPANAEGEGRKAAGDHGLLGLDRDTVGYGAADAEGANEFVVADDG